MNASFSRSSYDVLRIQTGMVLLLCLIFLTALTMLGLSASADTVLQHKLSANLQESDRAKQSALTALAWAENWLLELEGPALEACTDTCDELIIHPPGELTPQPEFETYSWWMEQGQEAGIDPLSGNRIATITGGSINPPVWIIEAAHSVPPGENGTSDLQVWYRLLARGSGQTKAAVSVIESTVVRSWSSIENTESTDTEVSTTCPGSEPTAKCGRISWRELR